MAFVEIVNLNEKRLKSREALMAVLMDAYDKVDKDKGEEIFSLTLRLNSWVGPAPTTVGNKGDM